MIEMCLRQYPIHGDLRPTMSDLACAWHSAHLIVRDDLLHLVSGPLRVGEYRGGLLC